MGSRSLLPAEGEHGAVGRGRAVAVHAGVGPADLGHVLLGQGDLQPVARAVVVAGGVCGLVPGGVVVLLRRQGGT